MKHIAVALVVVGLMACDLIAEAIGLRASAVRAWSQWNTLGLVGSIVWFFHHRDR